MFSFFNIGNAKYEKFFFDFKIRNISDEILDLSSFKDKTVLLVNVASNCGFTKQYSDLQNLYDKYSAKGLVVLGVPSNQFGGQEPGTNDEIKDFCETNFNITFPITKKYDVKGFPSYVLETTKNGGIEGDYQNVNVRSYDGLKNLLENTTA